MAMALFDDRKNQAGLAIRIYFFIFGFYILRFLSPPFTSFLFSLPFLVIFLCIMLGVSVCRFNIYQAQLQESQ